MAFAGLLALLVLALFADVLFLPGSGVAAYQRSDINTYFSASRAFGFGEISRGNLPLWDPHLFSGRPFVGNFQSALFYPPNLMYLVLPLAKAFNVDLALHVLLFGLLTFVWARGRGQAAAAAALAGSAAMFGSAFYLHVYAGHLTMLAGFAWTPLLFLAIDKTIEKAGLAWVLAGILSVTMQILAGLPQVLLVTGTTAGLYVLLRLIDLALRGAHPAPGRLVLMLAGLVTIAVAPLFLGAVQLWPGLAAAAASTRGDGVPLEFATSFSFPRENLAMLVAPHVFGGIPGSAYWGKWLYWEVSLYVGVASLMLAAYGTLRNRAYWYFAPLAGLVLLIALGRYAPLYEWLHGALPGFDSFRGPARFLTPAGLLLALLAGAGADRLLKAGRGRRWFAFVPLMVAAGLVVIAAVLRQAATDPAWRDFLTQAAARVRYEDGQSFRSIAASARGQWLRASGDLAVSAGLLTALGLLWAASGRMRPAAYAVIALAMGEVFMFGWRHRGEFELESRTLPQLEQFDAIHGEDARILHLWPSRPALQSSRLYDVWGYDPVVDRRYAEFFAHAAGIGKPVLYAGISNSFLGGVRPGGLLSLLRLAAKVNRNGLVQGFAAVEPLPRFLLVHKFELARSFKQAAAAMAQPGFDPAETVVLQAQPNPAPEPGGSGGVITVLDTGTDHAVLEVELDAPAILLNTDAYAEGWRAAPCENGPQASYEVMRADYALRAIPLAAGRHRIRLEYVPAAFTAGLWASTLSGAVLLAATLVLVLRRSPGAAL